MKRKIGQIDLEGPAIEAPVEQNGPSGEAAFGLWKGRTVFLPGDTEPLPNDGLAYQERMRAEWLDRASEIDGEPNSE